MQISEGELRSQIATLSAHAGMGYLNELTQRRDVDWQPVKLAFDSWGYKQEGLTPAGAGLQAAARDRAQPPCVWAKLMGATSKTTALMANAAFTSLATQASITLINNKATLARRSKRWAAAAPSKPR